MKYDRETLASAVEAAMAIRSIMYAVPLFESPEQADALADAFMAGGKAALELIVEANKYV